MREEIHDDVTNVYFTNLNYCLTDKPTQKMLLATKTKDGAGCELDYRKSKEKH